MKKEIRIAAIICASIWPLINFAAVNVTAILPGPMSLWQPAVFVALVAMAGILASLLLAKTRIGPERAFVLAIVMIVLFFSYAAIRNGSEYAFAALEIPLPPSLGYLAVICGALAASRFLAASHVFRSAVVIFAFVATGLAALDLTSAAFGYAQMHSGARSDVSPPAVGARLSGANVYYIVLDGYARRDALEEFLHYDNKPFLDRMRARGFYEAEQARANYLTTKTSVSAMFQGEYWVDEKHPDYTDPARQFPALLKTQIPPRLVRELTQSGYAFWLFGSFVSDCQGPVVHCLNSQPLFYVNYPAQTLVQLTPLRGILARLFPEMVRDLDDVKPGIDGLQSRKTPFLLFVHHLPPHPPYLYRNDCSKRLSQELDFVTWDPATKPQYARAIACINRMVESMTDKILATDPNAIIIFQSDHGSAFGIDWDVPVARWPQAWLDQRSAMLNLIYAPPDCRRWLRPDMAQVNTTRFILGCLKGQPPTYLPEKTFFTTSDFGVGWGKAQRYVLDKK